MEIVLGDENEGGQVIKKVFKIEAYEGYSAQRRRFGGDDEDQEQEPGEQDQASRRK